MQKNNLLEVNNLSIQLQVDDKWIPTVKNISFCVKPSQVVGIIGESGCGKSLSVFSVLKLLSEKKSIINGEVYFAKNRIDNLAKQEFRSIRGKKISMIFQDPFSSFNPVMKIKDQLLEVFEKNQRKTAKQKIIDLCKQVGLIDYDRIFNAFPHQLSGGMKQRIMIVMALLFDPTLLIADEPTTALDATVQVQILSLLQKLQQQKKMSLLLITHDLRIIAQMCDFVYVMYFGEIIEQGTVQKIFSRPLHPYTKGLMNMLFTDNKELFIKGKVPSIQETFSGCPFKVRCPKAQKICSQKKPKLKKITKNHLSACHFPNE